MSLPVNPGYEGFESPEDLYPGNTADLPLIYTGTYQIRQFGVGGSASVRGIPNNITSGLANPPANMVLAQTLANSYLGGLNNNNGNTGPGFNYPVTVNDRNRYFPGTGNISGGGP